jgi:hypothetical protein
MRRRLSTIDTWADDPRLDRPPAWIRALAAGVLILSVVVVLVALDVVRSGPINPTYEPCTVPPGTSPAEPFGKARTVTLRVDHGRWDDLDFSGVRWGTGVPAPAGLPDGPVTATVTKLGESAQLYGSDDTIVVDHVEAVLADGTRLELGRPGCD